MIFKVMFMYIMFWLILSEGNSMESIVIGTGISAVIGVFNKRYTLVRIHQRSFKNIGLQIKYWALFLLVLLREIVLANIHVAKVVLTPKVEISPCMTTFTTNLKSDFLRTILANSITLTPGTVTVDVIGDEFEVHCLKREYGQGLVNSEFEKILLRIEGSMND
ncbi:Na(+)/H(+) antiporter subunit E [Clostridium homopropionicum DSM 5847]|uniref:Na(+)/H(+) antiporter subunit E n=1 Tax=Clostridium homopropionicum DSM 5847 TaxID=1121318 RepID=A0A0L6Z574_9CLOT|nr:Na+/H+ antiporter subunit E [Clostridium homopropionicum]KOA18119.1 Na(+)/H(+) antiporter subunit E [Clostridium homopropionicum DSM 5847]SFG72459.1 multisubunit sodium/proton antiporter, MrpE subunit [Clostridium homopropionicum]